MNSWQPQVSYICANISDTSFWNSQSQKNRQSMLSRSLCVMNIGIKPAFALLHRENFLSSLSWPEDNFDICTSPLKLRACMKRGWSVAASARGKPTARTAPTGRASSRTPAGTRGPGSSPDYWRENTVTPALVRVVAQALRPTADRASSAAYDTARRERAAAYCYVGYESSAGRRTARSQSNIPRPPVGEMEPREQRPRTAGSRDSRGGKRVGFLPLST